MAETKPQLNPDFHEFEAEHAGNAKAVHMARTAESVRLGLTVLALVASIVIVGTSADTLAVYNSTTLGKEHFLSLWPNEFDLRPTTALIACGAIVAVISALSLIASKISFIRNTLLIHSAISFLAPTACFIAALTSTSLFYGVNSSNTNFSLQSWSCEWSQINMDTKPHWGTLCMESKAALYLTVMLIPLEVFVLATAAWAASADKKQVIVHERKGSPAMS